MSEEKFGDCPKQKCDGNIIQSGTVGTVEDPKPKYNCNNCGARVFKNEEGWTVEYI
mgnify:CR=1 FL=1